MCQSLEALFAKQAAERVIACVFPKSRAAMHLDTVFTMCDRDLVNVYPDGVEHIRPFSLRPATRPAAWTSGSRSKPSWRSSRRRSASRNCAWSTTGGDAFEQEREQWDDGNNVVALEPGVVVAYNRNVGTNTRFASRASRSSPSPAQSSGAGGVAATA